MSCDKEIKNIHAQLTTEISNWIDSSINKEQFEQLKNRLKSELSPRDRKNADNILQILEALERKGFISPGKYDDLIKILDEFDQRISADVIKPALERINEARQTKSDATPNSAIYDKVRGSNETSSPKSKKRKTGASADLHKLAFEKSSDQKGLIVIINNTKNREGTEDDVDKLETFFRGFNFEVELEINKTKQELKDNLAEIRDSYLNNPRISKNYYCFFCVVMGHGNEDGVATSDDKQIKMEEITNYFKNDVTKNFLGKPKIFIVQACRGSATQKLIVSDDHDDDDDDDDTTIDDHLQNMSLPNDADLLIAYATTHGNKAFRRKYSDIGAWFIHVLLEIIEENYEEDHFEDMLISVRHKLATDDQFRNGGLQMPCTWTTLTKRLYLSK